MILNYKYEHIGQNIVAAHSFSDKKEDNEFHLHNNYEIYFFIQGNVNVFVEKSCYKMQRGNLLVFNSQEIHKTVNLSDTLYERIIIQFNPHIIQAVSTEKTDLLSCFHDHEIGVTNIAMLDPDKINYYISTAQQMINNLDNDTFGSDLLPMTYLVQLLVLVNETFHSKKNDITSIISPQMVPILQFIDAHLTDDLSLDDISKEMSLDKYYLSHLFKKNTGSTVHQYILKKRIALSKQLLSQGVSVTETCERAGFNDYSNFIRSFKNATGLSPGNFINT